MQDGRYKLICTMPPTPIVVMVRRYYELPLPPTIAKFWDKVTGQTFYRYYPT